MEKNSASPFLLSRTIRYGTKRMPTSARSAAAYRLDTWW